MFNTREVATILAALHYWREEMIPHGPSIMRPYFKIIGFPRARPLSAEEVFALSQRLIAGLHGGRGR
jgi:hypothetical protein